MDDSKVRNFVFDKEGRESKCLLIIPKSEYHELALGCLTLMADPKVGMKLLAYTTQEGYRSGLEADSAGPAHEVMNNFLRYGGLTKDELGGIIKQATRCDNFEMATAIKSHIAAREERLGLGGTGTELPDK